MSTFHSYAIKLLLLLLALCDVNRYHTKLLWKTRVSILVWNLIGWPSTVDLPGTTFESVIHSLLNTLDYRDLCRYSHWIKIVSIFTDIQIYYCKKIPGLNGIKSLLKEHVSTKKYENIRILYTVSWVDEQMWRDFTLKGLG